MLVTWEDGGVCVCVCMWVILCMSLSVLWWTAVFFLGGFVFYSSSSSWDVAKLKLLFVGGYSTLIDRERIKKPTVCCSIQGLFIMYLLPLFKSLMQEVRSHMTERVRVREGAYVCIVWRNEDPCAVMFKQRFPQQPHAPLVPFSRLRDEAPPLPLTLMHPHPYAHTHSSPSDLQGYLNLWLRITLYKWYLCMSRDDTWGFDRLAVWLRRDSERWAKMADSFEYNVATGKKATRTRARFKTSPYIVDKIWFFLRLFNRD